jgi:hypothetical protein
MSALTKQQLRDAAPADQLPYVVQRQYGEPKLLRTFNEVRAELLKDVAELEDVTVRIGTLADFQNVAELRAGISRLTETDLPFELSVLVDEYTGVRYQVSVRDRRTS